MLLLELLRRARAWKERTTEERCTCGVRTHRSYEEIALFEQVALIEAQIGFEPEPPTIPRSPKRRP